VTSEHLGVGQYKAHHGGSGKIKGHDVILRNVLIVMRQDIRLTNVENHEKQKDSVTIVALLNI
jgi:hypothetical protein